MRRVVITGMGIVSSIGNNTQEVLASLHEAKSGITRAGSRRAIQVRTRDSTPASRNVFSRGASMAPILVDRRSIRHRSGDAVTAVTLTGGVAARLRTVRL